MKIELIAPRKVWVKGNPIHATAMAPLAALGFEFRERVDGAVTYITVVKPLLIELELMQDLIDLQQKIGDTLVLTDRYIEIGY